MILTFDNVEISYNDIPVFKGLSFSIGKCTIVQFVGKNGSGKSSILKAIAGINKPNNGNVLVNGHDFYDYPIIVNYIGHNIAVKPGETVGNNIAFWSALSDCNLMLDAAVGYFGLGDVIDEKCEDLSEGWNKKVALARLLAVHSDIWVLDEPEVHLDEESKARLLHAIEVRAGEGGIVFIASHNDLKLKNAITVNLGDFKNA